MKKAIIWVGWILIMAAFGFYAYGMGEAIRLSWADAAIPQNDYSEVLATTVSSMQTLLLANLGMLLGISVANPNSAVANQLLLNRGVNAVTNVVPPPLDIKDKIQLVAMVIFVISLIACLITWIRNDFSSESSQVVSVVSGSGKMFLGVVLAYITAALR